MYDILIKTILCIYEKMGIFRIEKEKQEDEPVRRDQRKAGSV